MVVNSRIQLDTRGNGHILDITDKVHLQVQQSGIKNGTVTLFTPSSTSALTTIEYESGLVEDFSELMEKIIPSDMTYHHDARWGDGNGFSHVRASLLGPSLTVPFTDGALTLGTWQQIVFLDFDNRSRSRRILLQFIGE